MRIVLPGYPTHLHYAVAPQQQARIVNALVAETLLALSPRSGKLEPRLVKTILVDKSDRSWTMALHSEARFHDGEKVKATDVLFSWDLVFASDSKALSLKQRLANWERPELLSDGRLRFKAKEKRFGMLETLADFYILSEKAHEKVGHSRTKIIGSGPYLLDEVTDGSRIVLRRNDHYWASTGPIAESWNADFPTDSTIEMTVESDPRLAWEKMKQGQFDYLYALSSGVWNQNILSDLQKKDEKTAQLKPIEFRSRLPAGVAVFAWNQRHPALKHKQVRCSLQALMDREFWREKVFSSAYDLAEGLFPTTSTAHAPELRVGGFAPEKAKRILESDGWTRNGTDVWSKGGVRLSFEMLLENPAMERLLTIYQDELRRAGIEMRLHSVDWASAKQRLQNHQYDAALVYRPDPGLDQLEEEWHSRFASTAPSLNRTGFQDSNVDRWLATLHTTFSEKKRQVLHHNIERRIVESCAVGLGWQNSVTRLVVSTQSLDPERPILPFADWTQAFWTLSRPSNRIAKSDGVLK